MSDRPERIKALLEKALNPTSIQVDDDSAAHRGHAGAASGGGHYRLRIRARAFAGLAPLECHRMIYAALGDMMGREIHALAIDAREA